MSALLASTLAVVSVPIERRPAGLCPWEDADAFSRLSQNFVGAYSPSGPAETSLVERLIWIEHRRARLRSAEAAVHVSHAFDRTQDSQAKAKTLNRAGVTDYKMREDLSLSEILRGSDQDDEETVAAIREGVGDVEAALKLIEQEMPYSAALARLDDDMRDWWAGELQETEAGKPKYSEDNESLRRFLAEDALPWRKRWLTVNEIRPAIRAQAIAESFDPPRIRQLWEMEARLDRQFEKALSMLIMLQEMRTAAGSAS